MQVSFILAQVFQLAIILVKVSHFVLSVALKLLDDLNAQFLRAKFLIAKLLHTKLNSVLLDSVDLLDGSLVLLNLIYDFTVKNSPKFLKLGQNSQLLTILIERMDLVKHSVCAINVSFKKLLVHDLVVISLGILLLVCFIVLVLAILFGLLSQRLVDQDVVKVLKFFKSEDCLELVALLALVASQEVGIVLHVQYLHIVLWFQIFQILDGLLQVGYFILTEREHSQLS